jgi:hypothetical protein
MIPNMLAFGQDLRGGGSSCQFARSQSTTQVFWRHFDGLDLLLAEGCPWDVHDRALRREGKPGWTRLTLGPLSRRVSWAMSFLGLILLAFASLGHLGRHLAADKLLL